MGLLPKENYISVERGEVVLVYDNVPPMLSKWTVLGYGAMSAAAILSLITTLGFKNALLLGGAMFSCVMSVLFLSDRSGQSDKARSALIIDSKSIGSNNGMSGGGYALWHQIKKIELFSELAPRLAQTRYKIHIYTKTLRAPIKLILPYLTKGELKELDKVLQFYCEKANIKFPILQ